MRVTGVTLVRDAVTLDFPIVEAVRSVLPLVDEMIVNVGRGADGTMPLLRERLADPRIRLLDRRWDPAGGGAVLARETQAALVEARGDWAVYVQADEVLHEAGLGALREAMRRALGDPRVEGLTVDFVHHYGDPGTVATARHWYRREVRVVRLDAGAASHHEAQGFRVGSRRVRARRTTARYHHYGWCRPAGALAAKRRTDFAIYGRRPPAPGPVVLPWEYGLRAFHGPHPGVMAQWIAARRGSHAPIAAPRWTPAQARLAASDLVERAFGVRLWEYRNYVLV